MNGLDYYAQTGCTIIVHRDVTIVSKGKPYMVTWWAAYYRRHLLDVDDTRKLRTVQRKRARKLCGGMY